MSSMLRGDVRYDLEILRAELRQARAVQDFELGAFGHSISLPAAHDLHQPYRSHRNNVPFSGALAQCPPMRAIFDSLAAEKASFRLLRRGPGTAYGLHDDRDKGAGVHRFQIPIVTNPASFLCVMREDASQDAVSDRLAEILAGGDLHFDYARFDSAFGEWFDVFSLPPGYLYRFDTNRMHTAINAGDEERIVLAIDLVENEWLEEWLARHVSLPVEPTLAEDLPAASWEWTSLRHGLLVHPAVEA